MFSYPERASLLFIFFFCVYSRFSHAALYIDDTSTLDKGKPEIDFSVDYYKDMEKEFNYETEEYDKTVCNEEYLYFSLTYGLINNLETGFTLPYKFLNDSSSGKVNGFSDIDFYSKYRLREESGHIPSYALSLDFKIDNANDIKGLGSGKRDLSANNIFTKTFGKKIFDLNLGYTFVGGKANDIFFYSFDFDYSFTEKFSLCNEIYGEKTNAGGFSKNQFCYGVSMSYQINDLISFDSGVGIGITKASPDYQISNSFTLAF